MTKPSDEKILIINGVENISITLKDFLTKNGFKLWVVNTAQKAIDCIQQNNIDLVISDFELTRYTGIEILQKIKILNPSIQVIIVTAYPEIRLAVEALKKGAFDYVTKPIYPDEILSTIKDAITSKRKKRRDSNKIKRKSFFTNRKYLVGPSYQSQLVQKHIDLIAPTNMSVIICGETGTGKEYVARSIHSKSKRSNEPFVAVDCGALPNELAASELFGHVKGAFTSAIKDKTGCFELANGGTLFLDEIGNLSYENQIQLLRVLQEQVVRKVGDTKEVRINVRVLVATNEDLMKKVKEGAFREDIFHRLNEFKIEIPPLRDRQADIDAFSQHFLKLANRQLDKKVTGFTDEALKKMKCYSWPGNLRELRNVIKRAVLISSSKEIDSSSLPIEIGQIAEEDKEFYGSLLVNGETQISLKKIIEQAEKGAIVEVLKQTDYNKSKTAELLQVDRKTLYNKIKSLGIPT